MKVKASLLLVTWLPLISLCLPSTSRAEVDKSAVILNQMTGSMTAECIQKQIATTGDNRLGTAMTAGGRYLIYCHDGAGNGAPCECLQGGATVTVASKVGQTLFAGEKVIIRVDAGSTQLSCQSLSATPYVDACPLQ